VVVLFLSRSASASAIASVRTIVEEVNSSASEEEETYDANEIIENSVYSPLLWFKWILNYKSIYLLYTKLFFLLIFRSQKKVYQGEVTNGLWQEGKVEALHQLKGVGRQKALSCKTCLCSKTKMKMTMMMLGHLIGWRRLHLNLV
jgi:hypothetical protein